MVKKQLNDKRRRRRFQYFNMKSLLTIITDLTVRLVPQRMEFNFDLWQEHLLDYAPVGDGLLSGDEIVHGLKDGFEIGIIPDQPDPQWNRIPRIPLSAEVQLAITDWLAKGVNKGYILGPFKRGSCPIHGLICSPLFAVPKPPLNGIIRYRPIQHLSYPKGGWGTSINDLIDPKAKEVHYTSFYDVLRLVDKIGSDGYLWVVDAQDAYYRVPIKQKYWRYFGLEWCGYNFVFTSLQMGLGSACRLYTQFADAIEYIILKSVGFDGVLIFWLGAFKLLWHYLDDFFGGHNDYNVAKQQFDKVVDWMDRLGIPTAPNKVSPPAKVQKILGYNYDTTGVPDVSVPPNKVQKALDPIQKMLRCKHATRKQLEKLIGLLIWISMVVFPAKAFVRRLEQVLHLDSVNDDDIVYLGDYVLADLRWWAKLLRSGALIGVPVKWLLKQPDDADVVVKTDAASLVGVGGWSTEGKAFQVKLEDVKWDWAVEHRPSLKNHGVAIQVLELMGSLVAARLWSKNWHLKSVTFFNDNPGAAAALINKNAKLTRYDMNYLIREFAQLAALKRYMFWGIHVRGADNERADALSRFTSWDSKDYQLEAKELVIKIVNDVLEELVLEPENRNSKKDM